MGGAASVVCELPVCFQGKCSVTLHDPGRNLLIALPCGILNDYAVFRVLRFLRGHADTFVIVQVFDGNRGILFGNVVQTGLCGTLRHPDGTLLSKLVRSPGNSASMIAVRRSKKGCLPKFFSELLGGQYIVRNLADILAGLLRDVSGDGIRTTEHLERVQAEAVGFVLYIKTLQTQVLSQPG